MLQGRTSLKRRIARHPGFAALLLAKIVVAAAMAAEAPPVMENPAVQVPAEIISVDLRVGDGTRSAYHIGEVIPVEMRFTSNVHRERTIDPERCMSSEVYPNAEPPGQLTERLGQVAAAMPFEGIGVCTTDGFAASIDLAANPYLDALTLNSKYLLDTP